MCYQCKLTRNIVLRRCIICINNYTEVQKHVFKNNEKGRLFSVIILDGFHSKSHMKLIIFIVFILSLTHSMQPYAAHQLSDIPYHFLTLNHYSKQTRFQSDSRSCLLLRHLQRSLLPQLKLISSDTDTTRISKKKKQLTFKTSRLTSFRAYYSILAHENQNTDLTELIFLMQLLLFIEHTLCAFQYDHTVIQLLKCMELLQN